MQEVVAASRHLIIGAIVRLFSLLFLINNLDDISPSYIRNPKVITIQRTQFDQWCFKIMNLV